MTDIDTKMILRLAEIIQLLATFPILVDIIGPKILINYLEKLLIKTDRTIRINKIVNRKIKKLQPLLVNRLLLKVQYQQFTPASEILRISKEIESIDKEIKSIGLGVFGKIMASFAFWLLLFLIFLQYKLLSSYFEDLFKVQWLGLVVYFLIMLIVIIGGSFLIPFILTGLVSITLRIIDFFSVKIILPFCHFMNSKRYGKIFARISYILFLIGFIIKFILI